MYLLAILLPPVAVLFSGKPVQAIVNFFLCLFFYIPGAIHAVLVVSERKREKLMKNMDKKTSEI